MEDHYQPSNTARSVFALALTFFALIAVNFPVQWRSVGSSTDRTHLGREIEAIAVSVTRAGFPWSAYTCHSASLVDEVQWRPLAIIGNSFFIVLVLALVSWWLLCRHRESKRDLQNDLRPAPFAVRHLSGGRMVLIGLAVYLAVVGGSTAQRLHREIEMMANLPAEVVATRCIVMPNWLTRRVPQPLRQVWITTQGVDISPIQLVDVSRLSQLPDIVSVGLRGGQLDDDLVNQLSQLPLLRMISTRGTDLSSLSPESIDKLTLLTSLKVSGPHLRQDTADRIARLPHVRELELNCESAIVERIVSQLTSKTIEKLGVTIRPETAAVPAGNVQPQLSNLKLSHLLNLKSFTISAPPMTEVGLSLADLPQFQTLRLNRSTLYSLSAERMQYFRDIELHDTNFEETPDDESLVIDPLFSEIHLSDVPSLSELRLHSRFLQRIQVSGAPGLSKITLDRWESEYRYSPSGRQSIARRWSDAERLSSVIKDLTQISNLRELTIRNLPLRDVDLTPLTALRRLVKIDLQGCDLHDDQVIALTNIEQLDSLILVRTKLKQEVIDSLLAASKRWKTLLINASAFDELIIHDQLHLENFFSQNNFRANRVSIVNAPMVHGELRLNRSLESLQIENVSKLRALIIATDLPAGSKISGIESLREFAARGPGLTDEIAMEVTQCSNLRLLSMSGSNVTKAGLKYISMLGNLDTLHLPEMPVDDEVVDSWNELNHLRDIVLDGTLIGPKSIERISRLNNLQRLSVSHTGLSPSDLQPLAAISTLIRLDVAGVGILPETLSAIGSSRMLYQLDLSGVKINRELLEVLMSEQLRGLTVLRIEKSGLSDDDFSRLAAANTKLIFECTRWEMGVQLARQLSREQRLIVDTIRPGAVTRISDAMYEIIDSPYLDMFRERNTGRELIRRSGLLGTVGP